MSEDFLTVSDLNRFIKNVVSSGFPQSLWVCGEIQGFRLARSGHIYFDLVDKDEGSKAITAKITAAIFANRRFSIENKLKKSENAFALKNDIEVKFSGSVNFYEPYGTLSFIVDDIDPTYTLGRLAQEKQKLIALLKKKGVLDQNKKLEVPLVPLNVGLITSADSAAFNDFHSELVRSDFGFKVYLRNALMQGKKAETDITQAIGELQKIKDLDVIVITRGGGSKADLSDFDSQMIAEKIASSRVPVLSGIGHEIDLSITDLAAHTFAKTPTAIAQYLVVRVKDFVDDMDTKGQHIFDAALDRINRDKQYLKDQAVGLQNYTMRYLKSHHERMITFEQLLKHKPQGIIKDSKSNLLQLQASLVNVCSQRFKNEDVKLKNFTKLIDIIHPKNTLKRGFSITRSKDGKVIRNIKDVNLNDEMSVEVVGGSFISEVKKIS